MCNTKVVLPIWHNLTAEWPSVFQTGQMSPALCACCRFPFHHLKNSLDRPFLTPKSHQIKKLEILTLIQIPSFSMQLGVVCYYSCIVYSQKACPAKWKQTVLLFIAPCWSWQVWLVVWTVTDVHTIFYTTNHCFALYSWCLSMSKSPL